MSNWKSYLIKFNLEKNIKNKIYLNDCQFGSIYYRFILVIIYNEYTFSANDRKTYRYQYKKEKFFYF